MRTAPPRVRRQPRPSARPYTPRSARARACSGTFSVRCCSRSSRHRDLLGGTACCARAGERDLQARLDAERHARAVAHGQDHAGRAREHCRRRAVQPDGQLVVQPDRQGTVPAMATTLVAFVGVRLITIYWIRPHLIAPAHTTRDLQSASNLGFEPGPLGETFTAGNPSIPNTWVLSSRIVDGSGHAATTQSLHRYLQRPARRSEHPRPAAEHRRSAKPTRPPTRKSSRPASISCQPSSTSPSAINPQAASGRCKATRRPSSSASRCF